MSNTGPYGYDYERDGVLPKLRRVFRLAWEISPGMLIAKRFSHTHKWIMQYNDDEKCECGMYKLWPEDVIVKKGRGF